MKSQAQGEVVTRSVGIEVGPGTKVDLTTA